MNRQSLDNRDCNLRQISNAENYLLNRRKLRGTSKYIGVSKDKRHGTWRAQFYTSSESIYTQYKSIYIGLFQTEQEAALAYDLYVIQNVTNPLRLNFPHEMYGLKTLLHKG